jgi:hypothetical protein
MMAEEAINCGIQWSQVGVSFVAGIVAALVAELIIRKVFGKKDFTVTYTEGDRTFTASGKPPETVNLERLARSFFKRK